MIAATIWLETFGAASRNSAVWNRDQFSIDRVGVMIGRYSGIRVTGQGVIACKPGIFIIPSGDTPVEIHVVDAVNEFIFGSIPAGLVSDIPLPKKDGMDALAVDPALLQSLYQFLYALVHATVPEDRRYSLRQAVGEVFRAIVQLVAHDPEEQISLFERARREIALDLSNQRLNADYLAPALGVSSRQLQLEFQTHGTTVQRELRRQRAAAALRARKTNPDVDMLTLAQMFGFGSKSTLYRALAEEIHRAGQQPLEPASGSE